MNKVNEVIAAMKAAHNPNAVEESQGGHVQELWQDGEVTLTKGGDLFRARNLHMIEFPILSKDNDIQRINARYIAMGLGKNAGDNVSVYVNDTDCKRIREMMEAL